MFPNIPRTARSDGDLRLSDQFFLLGHNQDTGQLEVQPDAFSAVLAAALTAEIVPLWALVGSGQIYLRHDYTGDDPAAQETVSQLREATTAGTTSIPLPRFLDGLRGSAYPLVARRLAHAGMMYRVETRRRFGPNKVTWRVAEHLAGVPRLRLMYAVNADDLSADHALLAGLVGVAQMGPMLGLNPARLERAVGKVKSATDAAVLRAAAELHGQIVMRALR